MGFVGLCRGAKKRTCGNWWSLGQKIPLWRDWRLKPSQDAEMAQPEVQAIANNQIHHGCRNRAHKPPSLHSREWCLYQRASSPPHWSSERTSPWQPLESINSYWPASMSNIHQSLKSLLGLYQPHFYVKSPWPKKLISPDLYGAGKCDIWWSGQGATESTHISWNWTYPA